MATKRKPIPVSSAARQAAAAARTAAADAGQPAAAEVITVVAVEPLRINGIDVAPGQPIDIDVDMAVDLVEQGLVRAAPDEQDEAPAQ